MSADGGTFLLLAGGADLVLVRGDDVEPVSDPRWKPFSIGMHGDQPLVGVHPVLTGRPAAGFRMPPTPPLVLAYDGRRWSTLLDEPLPEAAEMDPVFRNVVYRTTSFAAAAADDLWIADHYRYRIRRLTAAGRRTLIRRRVNARRPTAPHPARRRALHSRRLHPVAPQAPRDRLNR